MACCSGVGFAAGLVSSEATPGVGDSVAAGKAWCLCGVGVAEGEGVGLVFLP